MGHIETFSALQQDLWELMNKHTTCLSSCTMAFIASDNTRENIRRGLDITDQIEKKLEEILVFSESGVEWEDQESYEQFRRNISGILTELESSRILYHESENRMNTRGRY